MIIFNLEDTLADCEHRRHFVDPSKNSNYMKLGNHPKAKWMNINLPVNKDGVFKPDWKVFYEACGKDQPIIPVIQTGLMLMWEREFQIWSGRCESVRKKTIKWLNENIIDADSCYRSFDWDSKLKMRPIGDSTPEDELKEKWFDDLIIDRPLSLFHMKNPIDFVFDSDPKSIAMWKRRGVFVFNCCQRKGNCR